MKRFCRINFDFLEWFTGFILYSQSLEWEYFIYLTCSNFREWSAGVAGPKTWNWLTLIYTFYKQCFHDSVYEMTLSILNHQKAKISLSLLLIYLLDLLFVLWCFRNVCNISWSYHACSHQHLSILASVPLFAVSQWVQSVRLLGVYSSYQFDLVHFFYK